MSVLGRGKIVRARGAGPFFMRSASPANEMPHYLYVTRGVGHLMKIRLFCPPEITLITVTRTAARLT